MSRLSWLVVAALMAGGVVAVSQSVAIGSSRAASPLLSNARLTTPTPVYPAQDGFRDGVQAVVDVSEYPDEDLIAQVLNERNHIVHSEPIDTNVMFWFGILGNHPAPEGRYRIRFKAVDSLGGIEFASTRSFRLSHDERVLETWQRTISAEASLREDRSGRCSRLSSPGGRGWARSIGYLSNVRCTSAGHASEAIGVHSIRVPRRSTVQRLRLFVHGGAAENLPGSWAKLLTVRKNGSLIKRSFDYMEDRPGWHAAESWLGADAVRGHRYRFAVMTDHGDRYVAKAFRIKVKRWVLR